MSRVGKKPISVPKGVKVNVADGVITVKGPKGELTRKLHHSISLELTEKEITCVPSSESNELRKFHGLTRSLVNNMVTGVSEGYKKSLTLIGVGYRAAVKGQELQLTLGFSHPVMYNLPRGVQAMVDKQTVIELTGIDKEEVGQCAANIRSFRPPEPYHGKGVRYSDEVIVTKVGKAAGKK